MNIRLAERDLKTRFGDFLEILDYTGQAAFIAFVWEMSKTKQVLFNPFLPIIWFSVQLHYSNNNQFIFDNLKNHAEWKAVG